MSNVEQPVYCLALRVRRFLTGEIDSAELIEFLDDAAGPHQWLMIQHWLFRAPPVTLRPGALTVPVVCPQDAALRVQAADIHHQRVILADVIADVELRQWRWVAFQAHPHPSGRGDFPWEHTPDRFAHG